MFIPCEGIGNVVSRIVRDTGLSLGGLEFLEDKCVVTFGVAAVKSVASGGKAASRRPDLGGTMFKYPAGPWVKTDRFGFWKCEDYVVRVKDLAADRGVRSGVMTQRLVSTGMLDTRSRKSRLEKLRKGKRLSLP